MEEVTCKSHHPKEVNRKKDKLIKKLDGGKPMGGQTKGRKAGETTHKDE